MWINRLFVTLLALSFSLSCVSQQAVYSDTTFLQDYSVKYYSDSADLELKSVAADRNGVIRILSSGGLKKLRKGQFLYPGNLVPDQTYRTSVHKKFSAVERYQHQFVYLDNQAVFSQAWAGKLFIPHNLPEAHLLSGGTNFTFLISDGRALQYLSDSRVVWTSKEFPGPIIDIEFAPALNTFFVLGPETIHAFNAASQTLTTLFTGAELTAFAVSNGDQNLTVGTKDGYWKINAQTGQANGPKQQALPVTQITAVSEIEGQLWFGSPKGAFTLLENGKFSYYHGERWLPGNVVTDVAEGPNGSVLILTNRGLAQLHFERMTLHDKADFYQTQVRERHIRLGFNATLSGITKGDIAQGYLSDSDNDGLWTAMYLGAEAFRYAVTKSGEALANCRESLEAMERLYTINPIPGFPARSFERSGYIKQLADPHRWQHASDREWDWKATTSSDEAIGHMFAFGVIADLMGGTDLKDKAVHLMDILMQHILDNDLYLVDYDGKPTRWGRWNPDYVNGFPTTVGDRKLNSSNIIGMLQTAYHFTRKEQYKTKAYELMDEYQYLENLMRPMAEIGRVNEGADELSKMLSDGWNHSDDEMYFLGYWGLYHYAFDDRLKGMYRNAIIDHWQIERPERDGAWNIFTAMTGIDDFDLGEAAWYLREYPLDLIHWTVENSHRRDIQKVAPNFRGQTTQEVLPPDELPVARHNANRFRLDGGNGGRSEYSAGDIWLLPYWAGRYFGVISAPQQQD